MRRAPVMTVLALAAMTAGACGDRSGDTADTNAGRAVDSIAAVNTFRAARLVIEDVVAPAPIPAGQGAPPIAVYFRIRNEGAAADTLDRIEITGGTATLHQQAGSGGGMGTMVPLTFAVLPAGETIRFAPGGRHVMIGGLARPVTIGDVLPMTMVFRHAGPAPVAARVVSYGDLESVLSGATVHTGH